MRGIQPVPRTMRGQPGFRETFDTGGERVGLYLDKHIQMLPTCRGTIHYGRDGAYIIPARPPSDPDAYRPNKPHFELVDDISWCVDRALRGKVSMSLRALSFLFDVPSQIIILKAEVDRALSEDEREELRAVESEISADNVLATGPSLRNQTATKLVVAVAPPAQPLDPLPDGVAFLRAGEDVPARFGGPAASGRQGSPGPAPVLLPAVTGTESAGTTSPQGPPPCLGATNDPPVSLLRSSLPIGLPRL